MRVRCECGHEFVTEDHDEVVSFTPEAVVGPLGPDHVRDLVVVSPLQTCPGCRRGRYFALAVEATHLTTRERRELERFLLRYQNREAPGA